MLKVTYKHYKTGVWLEAVGEMPNNYNNGSSDRIVVKQPDGTFVDIIKSTIVRVEECSPKEFIC
jgi:hypothetical protein